MHPFEFFNVEACHFENATWRNSIRELDRMVVGPATRDRPANFECIKRASWFKGHFTDRNRFNVPGPFYGAETDTCAAGPGEAPENVTLDAVGQEFVFKQPENVVELKAVIIAASSDPSDGYGADGNDHWNLPLIREWWRARGAVAEWIVRELKVGSAVPNSEDWRPQQLVALHAFHQYLEERAETYLRAYAFYLSEKRSPKSGDVLPQVT